MDTSKVFIIADTHFGHKNIINYCDRPFHSVEQMDEHMIAEWNLMVGKDDIVFHLGDFSLAPKARIIEIGQRLNGRKRLVLGNHDTHKPQTYLEAGFEYLFPHPVLFDDFILLSHEPQYVQKHGVYAHVFGHVHDNPAYTDYSCKTFCACVERIEYRPIAYSKIRKLMGLSNEKPSN